MHNVYVLIWNDGFGLANCDVFATRASLIADLKEAGALNESADLDQYLTAAEESKGEPIEVGSEYSLRYAKIIE